MPPVKVFVTFQKQEKLRSIPAARNASQSQVFSALYSFPVIMSDQREISFYDVSSLFPRALLKNISGK